MLNYLDRHLPPDLDPYERSRGRFLLAGMGLAVVAWVLLVVPALVMNDPALTRATISSFFGASILVGLGYPALHRWGLDAAVVLYLATAWLLVNGTAVWTGGLNSVAFQHNLMLFVLAGVVGRPWNSAVLLGLSLGVGGGFWMFDDALRELSLAQPSDALTFASSAALFVNTTVLVVGNGLVQDASSRAAFAREQALEEAQHNLETTTVSTNYMRSVLAAARDMLIVTDDSHQIVDINAAVTELLGWTRQEMLGKALSNFSSITAQFVRNGMAINGSMNRADGRSLPVMVTRGRLESVVDGGELTGFVYALSDITIQEAAVEAVRRAHSQAEEANHAKSRFLANMSHELRTPLNAIIGYSELLGEEIDDPSQLEDLDRVRGAAHHLLQLINGILDLSKVEAGKTRLEVTEVMLDPLVHDVIATIRPNLREGVAFSVDAKCGGTARLDETKTRQILLNLLSNALKFTEKGTVSLRCERWDREGMPWLRFIVEDTGIGMTPTQLESIFEPFAQADATTERKYGGTGLGLSISQAFTRMMGGEIYGTSEPDVGTVFTVEVPIGELKQLRTPGLAPRADMPQRAGGQLVLCIDDDRSALELLSRLLSTETRQVVGTPDPEQGLMWARALRPNLITVDVQMPRMSGWNVLAQMQEDPELRSIRTIVITAEGEEQVARALGAAAILHKPVQRERLEEVVAGLLNT